MEALSVVFRRVGYSLILLVAVIVLNFLLIHLAPGDPAETIAGEMGGATQELLTQIRQNYGLDKSLPEQLLTYMSKVGRGDLGRSYFFNTPVLDLIMARVPATILLVFTSLFLALIVGTFMGVVASLRPSGLVNNLVTVLALLGYSVPVFWLGIMLLILFASFFPIFPVSGMYDVTISGGRLVRAFDILHHLVLPMFTLSLIYLAQFSRLARASMLDVLGSDYIRTARAKGLSEPVVVFKHALKNAIIPIVTITGLEISYLFSGAVLVETVFNWPGLGRLAFDSILRRDHPTILGFLLFSTFIVIVANLLTDLSYRFIDPRIRADKN